MSSKQMRYGSTELPGPCAITGPASAPSRSVPRRMSGVPQCPRGATRAGQVPTLASNQPPGPGSRWGGARAEPGPGAGPGRSRGGVCAGAGAAARAGWALCQQRKHRRSAAAEQVSRRGWGARAGPGPPRRGHRGVEPRPAGRALAPARPLPLRVAAPSPARGCGSCARLAGPAAGAGAERGARGAAAAAGADRDLGGGRSVGSGP